MACRSTAIVPITSDRDWLSDPLLLFALPQIRRSWPMHKSHQLINVTGHSYFHTHKHTDKFHDTLWKKITRNIPETSRTANEGENEHKKSTETESNPVGKKVTIFVVQALSLSLSRSFSWLSSSPCELVQHNKWSRQRVHSFGSHTYNSGSHNHWRATLHLLLPPPPPPSPLVYCVNCTDEPTAELI